MKTEQRKRDEEAMRFSGMLGHTFFEVEDDPENKTMNRAIAEAGSFQDAMRLKQKDSRIYQKIGKRKYKLVG